MVCLATEANRWLMTASQFGDRYEAKKLLRTRELRSILITDGFRPKNLSCSKTWVNFRGRESFIFLYSDTLAHTYFKSARHQMISL